ncbi:MAG TPA: phage/plasmid primase, P4 family, partial [Longimicrobiales bacterium]
MHWTGTHYRAEDAEAALERAIVEVLLQRQRAGLDAKREDIARCCVPSARHIRDAKYNLRSLLRAGVEEFDRHPDLLNCLNGVVHLPTGTLTPHEASPHELGPQGAHPRFTYCVPVAYHPAADRRPWLAFLAAAVAGGPELLAYLQQAAGYSLTGHTSEECLFYLFGPTRAGKGTFQETLTALLSKPLAYQVDFAAFTARRDADANNFDLAPLKPARLVFAGESNRHQTLNPGKIKQLTGGDDVFCAHKFRAHFSYRPQYKIWLVSNHPVNADVDDDALWARVRVIEFPHSRAGREDTSLKERLREPANLAGVLAWAVEGAVAWYAAGRHLQTPPVVAAATEQQRAALDFVAMWLEECTTTHHQADGAPDPAHYATNERLYASYETWCRENGVEPKKQRGLSEALRAKGYRVGVARWVSIGALSKTARVV